MRSAIKSGIEVDRRGGRDSPCCSFYIHTIVLAFKEKNRRCWISPTAAALVVTISCGSLNYFFFEKLFMLGAEDLWQSLEQ
jgi:hypothetical protein